MSLVPVQQLEMLVVVIGSNTSCWQLVLHSMLHIRTSRQRDSADKQYTAFIDADKQSSHLGFQVGDGEVCQTNGAWAAAACTHQ